MKWLLLAVFLLTLPVPFLALEAGNAPPLRLLFIGSLTFGVLVQDPDLISGLMTLMYLGEGLLWSVALYFFARFVARRLEGRASRNMIIVTIAALLLAASLLPIYRTPFSSTAVESNILGIFD